MSRDLLYEKEEELCLKFKESYDKDRDDFSLNLNKNENEKETVPIIKEIGMLKELKKVIDERISYLQNASREMDKNDNFLSDIKNKINELNRVISCTEDKEIKVMLYEKKKEYDSMLQKEKEKYLKANSQFDSLEVIKFLKNINQKSMNRRWEKWEGQRLIQL